MRRVRGLRLLGSLLVLWCALAPAIQADETFTLVTTAARTAAGQGASTEIGAWRNVSVWVNVSAGSGTVTVFRVWLEGNPVGTDWHELPCSMVLKTGAAAPGAAAINQRDIVSETAVQTSAKYAANCPVYTSRIRVAWNIVGTTPSETFSVIATAK